jgi:hypothetical protein
MGEHADDLIDAGMMEGHYRGYWGYSYRRSHKPHKRHKIAPKSPKALQNFIEIPKISNEDFEAWYNKINWNGCSRYEIAGMAWHEAAKRCDKQANDDHFTWWFDELNDIYHIFKIKIVAKMAWKESIKRLDITPTI